MKRSDYQTTDYGNIGNVVVISEGTNLETDMNNISFLASLFTDVQGRLEIIKTFNEFSQSVGGYVKLLERYDYFPVLIGSDGRPVPVFVLIEALDGAVDYDQIKEELPNLSYSQIHSAISFLRKVSQINLHGSDLDEIENTIDVEDNQLMSDLKKGLADKEIARVLYQHKQNG